MPFDPARDLPVILGSLAGMGRGSNAFSRRWMQLEQMRQQQQMEEQQMAQQADFQQQRLMLDADAATRARDAAARQEREAYTNRVQQLYTNEGLDSDVALNLSLMGMPAGYDEGAIRALHARVFTPDEKTRREAVRALKDIDEDPQIKRLIQAGESIDALTFERLKLGGNPEFLGDKDHPPGSPLYTRAQLQRLGQKTAPTGPLPQARTDRALQREQALIDGQRAFVTFDPASGKWTDAQGRDVSAKVQPIPPEGPQAAQGSPQWVIGPDGQQVYRIPRPGDKPFDEVAARQRKDEDAISQYSLDQATRTIAAIDDVLPNISNLTAGIGSVLSRFPGTPAANVRAELASVAGNIAFQALQAMREASKTGGALGQVSDIELRLLSSVEGAIAQDQSPANLRRQLTKIRESMERLKRAAEQQRMNGGTVQLGPGVTTGQAPDGWIDVGGGVRIREKK